MPTVTGSAPPERSIAQRQEALLRANAVRTERAQLKRDLKAGTVSVVDVLREPPPYVETAKVFDVLLAVPKYGHGKVSKCLSQCLVSPSRTLAGLSKRQRADIITWLGTPTRERTTSTTDRP